MIDRTRQIARRTPSQAAFQALVWALGRMSEEQASALVDELEPTIATWPVETRVLEIGPRGALGPAARRLARRLVTGLALHGVPASAERDLREMLEGMSSLVDLALMPLHDHETAQWLALAPASVRRVSLWASPPRRDAERFASTIFDALVRFESLEGVSLLVGHATPFLAPRVLERRLVAFSTRLAELADPSVLDRLEPSTMRLLNLHGVDGVPPAWTPAVLARAVERLPELVDLACPWIEPRALETLRSLERLRVTPAFLPEAADVDAFFASLPPTLRALAVPGISGDAVVGAFARCPALEDVSWIGSKLSADGVRALVASGALGRLTSMQLNGALERKEARLLFERGAPQRLRNLDLFGMALGDATIRALAKSPAWLEGLVTLDVRSNDLSSKGLAALLDVLVDRAEDLVSLSVDGNRLGPDAHERLSRLEERGVIIDVELPEPPRSASPRVDPPAAITAAWRRADAWLEANAMRIPGLGEPAAPEALAGAAHLPPSLRALYAAHDGSDEAELLGLGRAVWWRLADVVGGPLEERDERMFAVFASPLDDLVEELYEPGELPSIDDELDVVFAVAVDTEEVVALGPHGTVDVIADSLGAALDAVVTALESGQRTIDESGRLVHTADVAAPAPAPPPAASLLDELVAALVDRHVLELREGTTQRDLAAALAEALNGSTSKPRTRAVLAVFDSPLVDEVFVDEDELRDIAHDLVRQLA